MRVEINAQENEHEWTVSVETDQSVTIDRATTVARNALIDLCRHVQVPNALDVPVTSGADQ